MKTFNENKTQNNSKLSGYFNEAKKAQSQLTRERVSDLIDSHISNNSTAISNTIFNYFAQRPFLSFIIGSATIIIGLYFIGALKPSNKKDPDRNKLSQTYAYPTTKSITDDAKLPIETKTPKVSKQIKSQAIASINDDEIASNEAPTNDNNYLTEIRSEAPIIISDYKPIISEKQADIQEYRSYSPTHETDLIVSNRYKSLIGAAFKKDFWISANFNISTVNGSPSSVVGGALGWAINDSLNLGLYGYGVIGAKSVRFNNQNGENFNGKYSGGYGGVVCEYYIEKGDNFDYGAGGRVGIGNLSLYTTKTNHPWELQATISPRIFAETQIKDCIKIGITLDYEYNKTLYYSKEFQFNPSLKQKSNSRISLGGYLKFSSF